MVHAVLGSLANLVNVSHLSGFNFPEQGLLAPPDSTLPPMPVVIPLPRLKLTLSVDCLPLVNFRGAGAFCFLSHHVPHMIGAQEVFAK